MAFFQPIAPDRCRIPHFDLFELASNSRILDHLANSVFPGPRKESLRHTRLLFARAKPFRRSTETQARDLERRVNEKMRGKSLDAEEMSYVVEAEVLEWVKECRAFAILWEEEGGE